MEVSQDTGTHTHDTHICTHKLFLDTELCNLHLFLYPLKIPYPPPVQRLLHNVTNLHHDYFKARTTIYMKFQICRLKLEVSVFMALCHVVLAL